MYKNDQQKVNRTTKGTSDYYTSSRADSTVSKGFVVDRIAKIRELVATVIDLAVENGDIELRELKEQLNQDKKSNLITYYGNELDSEVLNDPWVHFINRVEVALKNEYSFVVNVLGYNIGTSEEKYNSFRKRYLDSKDKSTEKDTTSKDKAKN